MYRIAHISDTHVLSRHGELWSAGYDMYDIDEDRIVSIAAHAVDSSRGGLRRTEIEQRASCI